MPGRHDTAVSPASGYSAANPPVERMSVPARMLVVAALIAGAVYLGWRWGFTLDGASLWVGTPLALAETYALIMLALLAFSCWALSDRPQPPPLRGRRVAIFIATYNESEDVLRPTVVGALRVRHSPAAEVWVLDDGDRAWVRRMCGDLGVGHLARPAPRLYAKAGNINHALRHVDAEFIVTLDADHVPRPELLERMLGYFSDERVALVQAPQTFYNRGFQHVPGGGDPLHHDQSVFFDAVCRGKDRHDAAFWCGCPSVLRSAALMEVGGVATATVVEDFHTSMKMQQRGWRTVYHPEIMALGLAPEEIGAFVVQRGRWARGCLQVLARDTPLVRRGLTFAQRIEYTTSCVHFLEGLQRLVLFLAPVVVLSTGLVPVSSGPLTYAMIFAPQLILTPLASRALTRGRYRILETERYSIVRMEAYITALTSFLPGRTHAFTVTPKGARDDRAVVARALRLPMALVALTAAALAYQACAQVLHLPGRLALGALAVTATWAVANAVLMTFVVAWARSVRHRRRDHRFPADIDAIYGDVDGGVDRSARVLDLARHGARLIVSHEHARGDRVDIDLSLDRAIRVRGTVVALHAAGTPGLRGIGVEFDTMPADTADAIVEWCFQHPFSPVLSLPSALGDAPADALRLAFDEVAAAADPVDDGPPG